MFAAPYAPSPLTSNVDMLVRRSDRAKRNRTTQKNKKTKKWGRSRFFFLGGGEVGSKKKSKYRAASRCCHPLHTETPWHYPAKYAERKLPRTIHPGAEVSRTKYVPLVPPECLPPPVTPGCSKQSTPRFF